jgi:hypothetical protein
MHLPFRWKKVESKSPFIGLKLVCEISVEFAKKAMDLTVLEQRP